jgi:hypothetical protein
MKSLHSLIPLVAALLLGGCASIQVDRIDHPTEKQGFKVYPPKPYILMARAGDGGKVISVTPVMLPDLSDPHIISQKTGIGSANLSFTVENGTLKTFGGVVDSKVPETIKEVGGLVTGYGALVKSLADAGKVKAETEGLRKESADRTQLNTANANFKSAADSIGEILVGSGLSTAQKSELGNWKSSIEGVMKLVDDPATTPAVLNETAIKLNTVAGDFEKASTNYPTDLKNAKSTASVPAELRAGTKLIAIKTPDAPVFELYEVKQDANGTSLVLVFPKP